MNRTCMKSEEPGDSGEKSVNILHNNKRWEDIELSEINADSIQDTNALKNFDCDNCDDVTMKDAMMNWARESAKQALEDAPDFITNVAFASTMTLLLYLVLRNNGLTSENLQSFLNLSYIWLSSIVGGYLIRLLRMPPLLGMIMTSAIVSNATDINIPEKVGETISSSGLAIILLLSGLEIDTKTLTRSSGIAIRLTCIPGVVEAFISGFMAMILFDMPFWLGLSMGFILAAVSPALIVVGMLKLQRSGYGVKKGIPSLIVAAASMDDIVAITGFSFFIGLAIQSPGDANVLFSAIHGPLSIIVGVTVGGICGSILSITRVLNRSWKRTVIAILLVLCQMFLLKKLSFAGAGALASLVTGIVASHYWEKGTPKMFSLEEIQEFTKSTEAQVSVLWSLIFEPLLFGFIGSSLDFNPLGRSFSKSFGILTIGIMFRLTAAYFATMGGDTPLTKKERLFISLVWTPKATVQAVLCSFPLLLVKDVLSPDNEDYDRYILWGNQIMSTAILSILITAPLGLGFIQFLGPRWLSKDDIVVDCHTEKENEGKNENDETIKCHVSKIDELVRDISLSSNQVETSCILAELRQVLWQCRTILKMKGKNETV